METIGNPTDLKFEDNSIRTLIYMLKCWDCNKFIIKVCYVDVNLNYEEEVEKELAKCTCPICNKIFGSMQGTQINWR